MDLDMSYERNKGLGHKEIVNVAARLAHLACGLVGVHDRSIDCVCETRVYERLGWHVEVAIEDEKASVLLSRWLPRYPVCPSPGPLDGRRIRLK